MSWRRKARSFLLIALINALIIVGALSLWTWKYRRGLLLSAPRLKALSLKSGIPVAVLHGLASFEVDGARRDFRALPQSAPGAVRIGAFGDSFTFGAEVKAGLSFPSLLQEQFRKDGFTNVEVINFGSSGLSFGESTHLWETFGRDYSLDFIVLGPMGLFFDREMTFNHFFEAFPDAIHGRYVLERGELRWWEPLGKLTEEDRIAEYLRLLPRWSYLRYDRNPPLVIRALTPAGRVVRNPFYFSSSTPAEEADQLYPALLRRWASGGSQVIFTQMDSAMVRYADGLRDQLVAIEVGGVLRSFADRRTQSHLSGVANDRFAHIVHDVLLDRQPALVEEIAQEPPPGPPAAGKPLVDFDRADVYVGEQFAGILAYAKVQQFDGKDDPVDFHRDAVRSLLFFHAADSPISGVAVTGRLPLRDGLSVEADLTCGEERIHKTLGAVVALDDAGSLGAIASPVFSPNLESRGRLNLLSERLGLPRNAPCKGAILVGGVAVLSPEIDPWGTLQLLPVNGRLVVSRALVDTYLDVARLPPRGSIHLRLNAALPLDVTVGTFAKRTSPLEWNRSGLHAYIRAATGHPSTADVVHR
jgi:hypothetical protein